MWEEGKEPLEEVNLLMAIRWIVDAWEEDVKKSTLVNCFRKGRVLPLKTGHGEERDEELDEEADDDLESDQANIREELERTTMELILRQHLVQALTVDEYVAPGDKEVYDPEADLTAHIVATIDLLDTEPAEELQAETPQEKVTHDTALTSIETLLIYAEQQQSHENDLRAVHSLRRVIKQRRAEMKRRQKQRTLDTWVN